jgi:hypothetical protein
MIIRRGGGGQGFDPNGAVLKVVTSTGCTVAVTNATAGYSKTHQQADGYPRSNDADVTEHFFSIPASAFGTLTVVATNTYGTNTKTITVNTAGKVYELLCGGLNIILNSTFGLQEGYSWKNLGAAATRYNETYKRIEHTDSYVSTKGRIEPQTPITQYDTLTVSGTLPTGIGAYKMSLRIDESTIVCSFQGSGRSSGLITDKHYPSAYFYAETFETISEIVLS